MKKQNKVIDKFVASNGFTIELAPDAKADIKMTAKELNELKFIKASEVLPQQFFDAMAEMSQNSKKPVEIMLDDYVYNHCNHLVAT